jgi:hypothetical protein
MSDSVSLMNALFALLLPWILGSLWAYWLLGRCERWNFPIVLGHGYLVGLVITTLLIRAWGAAGLTLSYSGIASALLGLGILAIALIRLQPARQPIIRQEPPLARWQLAVTLIFIGLLALRYGTIIQELLLRPLFPWDAWMNWAPKSIVWFHYKELVPFVNQEQWLSAPAEALSHIEGAKNAWQYPVFVPLVQLWTMLAIGTSDHTVIYMPWVFIAIALGLALYGHLRLQGASLPLSITAVYILLNLPFLNVHSALAGYADLWVAIFFGCAVFALKEWEAHHCWPYAVLAMILAIFCSQIKIPGIIMGGIVILVFCSSLIRAKRGTILLLSSITALLVLLLFYIGIEADIPGLGTLTIRSDQIDIPYIGQFELEFHPVHAAMEANLLLLGNWNIVWYLLPIALLVVALKPALAMGCLTEIKALITTLAFIFFVYYFTERYRFAVDYTQVNRALVYAVPVIVFFMANAVSLWCAGRKKLRRTGTA